MVLDDERLGPGREGQVERRRQLGRRADDHAERGDVRQGLGAHAASDVRYNLGGNCTRFRSDIGVDDEVASSGTVVFQVYADGAKLYDSGVMNGASATKTVDIDVSGKNELQLVVADAGDGISSDHADWAGLGQLRPIG